MCTVLGVVDVEAVAVPVVVLLSSFVLNELILPPLFYGLRLDLHEPGLGLWYACMSLLRT